MKTYWRSAACMKACCAPPTATTATCCASYPPPSGQISALQYLEARSLLAALPPALRETAELRLKNPDASLEQLGEMLDPPLGKSGVNHRLRKIMQYAQASGAPVLNGDDQNDDPEAVPQA